MLFAVKAVLVRINTTKKAILACVFYEESGTNNPLEESTADLLWELRKAKNPKPPSAKVAFVYTK